jgi:hypothetical protein
LRECVWFNQTSQKTGEVAEIFGDKQLKFQSIAGWEQEQASKLSISVVASKPEFLVNLKQTPSWGFMTCTSQAVYICRIPGSNYNSP